VPTGTGHSDLHTRVQAAGKQLIIYCFSLMKTGEIHDLNNDAYNRPIEKMLEALAVLFKIERQALTVVIYEGTAQVNSHALWLDPGSAEQAQELEMWLARREAGGMIFTSRPSEDELRRFFYRFARFRAPADTKDQLGAMSKVLVEDGIKRIKLAPQPLELEGVGQGARGVASLWHYAKGTAGMQDVFSRTPIDVKAARRVAQELTDTAAAEQDLLIALPLMGTADRSPARQAVDVAVLSTVVTRGLGLSPIACADIATNALLHDAGHAYPNPDPAEFTVDELSGVMAIEQLVEASKLTPMLARRVAAGVEKALGAHRSGPPYLVGASPPLPETQIVILARRYLELVRGGTRPAQSPLEAALGMLQSPPRHVELPMVQVFVAAVGFLPVGSVVELQNEDLAVVSDVDHLRGRGVYGKRPAPVTRKRKIHVERMRDAAGQLVPERKARVELGTENEEGQTWAVRRTPRLDGLRDLAMRAIIRRPATVVQQMGLR